MRAADHDVAVPAFKREPGSRAFRRACRFRKPPGDGPMTERRGRSDARPASTERARRVRAARRAVRYARAASR